jgi:HlyD family secretion protein
VEGVNMKKSKIIIITIIVTLVVVFVIGGIIKSKTKPSENALSVRIETVQRGQLIEIVSAPGEIEPKTKVEISAKVSARVVELPFKEGQTVSGPDPDANPPVEGSVLIKLDSKDLESRLRSAKANHKAQQAQIEVEKARVASQRATMQGTTVSLKQAQRDFERQKKLLQSQDISQSTFDQTQCRFDELKSQYEMAGHNLKAAELNLIVLSHHLEGSQAQIEQAQEALSYTTIRSPIDGVITRINAEVGEVVMTGTMNNPGTIIMEVADLAQMLIIAQVDEADVAKLEVAQNAVVRVQAYPEKEFKGVVDTIALAHNRSGEGAKFFKTEILLDVTGKKLFSGLTADVDIETHKHDNVLKVPSQAVLGRQIDTIPLDIRENNPNVDSDKTYVAVVYKYVDGKTVVTPVKIGKCDLTHTIILDGIAEGDKIVVGPYKILSGIKHDKNIIDEKEKAAKEKMKGQKESEPNSIKDKKKDKQGKTK